MLNSFAATLSPMLVMFLCIAVGYTLNKTKLLPENAGMVMSKLETYVFLPALIIHTFLNYCTLDSIRGQYKVVLFGLLVTVLCTVVGIALSWVLAKGSYEREIYRYGLSVANFSFLGNTIVPQILGAEALYPYLLFTLPLNALVYGYLVQKMIPEGKGQSKGWKQFLNPTFISMIIGMVLGMCGGTKILPGFLSTTVSNLSACMGPVAMVLTGFVIGGYDFKSLLKHPKVYVVTFLRLLVLPAAYVALVWLLGADEQVMCMTLLATGSALGLNTVVIPAAYGGDTRTGAAMAMISHVLCIVTIPLLYALLTWLV